MVQRDCKFSLAVMFVFSYHCKRAIGYHDPEVTNLPSATVHSEHTALAVYTCIIRKINRSDATNISSAVMEDREEEIFAQADVAREDYKRLWCRE